MKLNIVIDNDKFDIDVGDMAFDTFVDDVNEVPH